MFVVCVIRWSAADAPAVCVFQFDKILKLLEARPSTVQPHVDAADDGNDEDDDELETVPMTNETKRKLQYS